MLPANSARGLLLASVALFPTSVLAQTAPTAPPPSGQAAGSTDQSSSPDQAQAVSNQTGPAATQPAGGAEGGPPPSQGSDIVVTGSRIAKPDFERPNPIVSFNSAAIQQSGNTNLTNFLERVPALTGSRDSTDTSGGNGTYYSFGQTGLNELNLRDLGTNRTLVLVNGRRHVAGEPNTAAVDINTIPTDLVERVDVLTGAVGAVYGADGVTGVVNFILKRNFQGLSARTQIGISTYGDAGNRFASVLAGHNFADGRGNVTFAYEYDANDPVANDDRSFLRFDQRQFLIPNNNYVKGQAGSYQNILVGGIRYDGESPIGLVYVGDQQFNGLGQPYDNGTAAAYYRIGGNGTPVAGFFQGDLLPKTERHDINAIGHYDFSDAISLSLEGKYVRDRVSSFGQYTGTYYYPISIDNAFLPASIRAAAIAAGTTANGVFTPADIYATRDDIDYGRPGERDLRQTYRGVIDGSGRISDHATWDAYFEYGRTDDRVTRLNDRLAEQYADAIDARVDPATGQIVCNPANNPTAGCIPISLFGPGPATPAQLAYFEAADVSRISVTQKVASASVSGDFGQFFSLPGGPVKFAFGGEYRREGSRFDPNSRLTGNEYFQYDEPGLVQASRGHFDVKELFGELDVPLLKNLPFAQVLSVGAAGRYSHYSTVGDTKTWSFNGTWSPIRDLTFRGSYGRSVRAPNIGELFQPRSGTTAFITDPCDYRQVNNGTQYRAANCAAALAAVNAAYNPATAQLTTGQFANGVAQGNLGLDPEVARTWTAGILLRPRFLPGLNASIDWYDINLKKAIQNVDPNTLIVLCVDQPTLDNQYCGNFTRAQGTGIVNSFVTGPVNVAQFRTAGADLNIDYLIRTARVGSFDIRLVGGYLNRFDTIGTPGGPVINGVDVTEPKWNANFSPTWTIGGLSINYNLQWHDAIYAYDRNTLANSPDIAAPQYLRFDALWQHDAQVRYTLEDGFAFYVGVNNFTNQKPDPASFSTNTPISPLGRFFYAGAKVNFGK